MLAAEGGFSATVAVSLSGPTRGARQVEVPPGEESMRLSAASDDTLRLWLLRPENHDTSVTRVCLLVWSVSPEGRVQILQQQQLETGGQGLIAPAPMVITPIPPAVRVVVALVPGELSAPSAATWEAPDAGLAPGTWRVRLDVEAR